MDDDIQETTGQDRPEEVIQNFPFWVCFCCRKEMQNHQYTGQFKEQSYR